jgi:large subunit ribosomal protein L9
MKVILLKDVRGVGRRHEVKNVADGYAVNFLFPHKAAEPATEEKLKHIQKEKDAALAQAQALQAQLQKKLDMLRGARVIISSRATEKGGLFKAVSTKDIAKAILAQHSLEIPEAHIIVGEPVRTTGEHAIQLKGAGSVVPLTVVVTATQ